MWFISFFILAKRPWGPLVQSLLQQFEKKLDFYLEVLTLANMTDVVMANIVVAFAKGVTFL